MSLFGCFWNGENVLTSKFWATGAACLQDKDSKFVLWNWSTAFYSPTYEYQFSYQIFITHFLRSYFFKLLSVVCVHVKEWELNGCFFSYCVAEFWSQMYECRRWICLTLPTNDVYFTPYDISCTTLQVAIHFSLFLCIFWDLVYYFKWLIQKSWPWSLLFFTNAI